MWMWAGLWLCGQDLGVDWSRLQVQLHLVPALLWIRPPQPQVMARTCDWLKMWRQWCLVALLLLSLAQAQEEAQCKTSAKADIILLVDGSWSIARINFKTIRNFIAQMVSVFDIGPERVQIGLAQYSGDPKTEWHLNAHPTRASLLEAVANLPYKGGNTMTGMALNYILQNNFRPNVGLRPDSRKIGVLITDGKSQDEIVVNSQNLRDSGIELYAIGVKNADENELRSIASDPDDIHMYNVGDFKFLVDIVDELTVNLCNSVKGSVPLPPAGALRITDVTHSTMKLTWDAAPAPVRRYIITYKPMEGDLKELEVNGDVTSTDLTGLISQTEYDVAVTPFYDLGPTTPMLNSAITDVVPAPKNLRLSEVTQTSFRATWEHGAPDVALYRLGWTKAGEADVKFAILNAEETTFVLPDLDPDTEYSVTVTAIYPDESESEDLMGSERTHRTHRE